MHTATEIKNNLAYRLPICIATSIGYTYRYTCAIQWGSHYNLTETTVIIHIVLYFIINNIETRNTPIELIYIC